MERYLINMVRAMAAQVSPGSLVAFGSREGLPCLDGIMPVVKGPVFARTRWARIVWEQTFFPKITREWNCDVMISFGNVCPIRLPGPSLVVMHDLIPFTPAHGFTPLEKAVARLFFRMSARAADGIVTVSNFSKDRIMETMGVAESRISVIPGACDPVFFQKDRTKNNEKPFILAGASALPHKNLEGLLQAYKSLISHRHKDARLVITHTHGTDQKIMARVRELGLEGQVSATGKITDTELAALYRNAAVFVYPSLYEGFGLPVLEAMASGTPVIASRVASLPEVAGDCALLVDSRKPGQLAEAMGLVLKDLGLRQKLTTLGRERVATFSWENSATTLLALAWEASRKKP